MSSPEQDDVAQHYSCRCHNITITTCNRSPSSTSASEPSTDYHHVYVGEGGINITHHYLTLRTRDRAQESNTSPNKLLQHLALSCLACKTFAYRVTQEISPGSEAREGPVAPTEDWVEQETLRSKSGWIEVFIGPGGCLVGRDVIERHLRSLRLSDTFSIGILSQAPMPASRTSTSQPWINSPSDDSADSTITPTQILPSLPPLFPPPPFAPSHPVFLMLSACAIKKSTGMRQQAEEDARDFVRSKLDELERNEARLRSEVEGIWRGYREGWKEVIGRVNEERRLSLTAKSDISTHTSSVKSGIPMSIRDFSPIVRSHPQAGRVPTSPIVQSSASLLSTSLVQTGTHTHSSSQPLVPETTTLGGVAHAVDSGDHNGSNTLSSYNTNGMRVAESLPSISPGPGDSHFPGAFKRNMDTNVDIASSVAWAQGEEEMRRRFEGTESEEPRERARKRTSKDLGIGGVEAKLTPMRDSTPPISKGGSQSEVANISVAESRALEARMEAESSDTHGKGKRTKRRVTFDVQPEVAITQNVATAQANDHAPEVELFDLDDPSSTEPFSESDLLRASKPTKLLPINRTPSYKLRPNDSASTARALQPTSLPIPRAIPPRSPVDKNSKWAGGSARRSVGLADALPLLSSSVPAGDRVLVKLSQTSSPMSSPERQYAQSARLPSPPPKHSATSSTNMSPSMLDDRTPSPAPPSLSPGAIGPTEAELKNLLAASAPSHRHAWKEGGRAWEMFHQRSRNKKKVKGAIAEEGSDHTSSSLDDGSDVSMDEDPTRGTSWRNPSHFASSLPVQIRPLAQYQPTLEPKTSLTDKQGVLVPPLNVTNSRKKSATAFRKAVYAERDRIRLIDPGPTLDFNEEENEEDDILDESSNGNRGRRHALSILQARSVIPEAGMWRSMAS